jgi:hypothetical protein
MKYKNKNTALGATKKKPVKRNKSKPKIDIRSNDSVYVTVGDYVYYIDDSTNEQIVEIFPMDMLLNMQKQ